ncbi:uncharacterized protein LOC115599921 [Calypte anna]|uniref:uncharacterized protein LOC115599921 n=1 Tax=Calypte anna TaxID=9244 RepID=UPI0011C3FE37|nr:uncharacterized protein LOC115599921 [Calypte anna]
MKPSPKSNQNMANTLWSRGVPPLRCLLTLLDSGCPRNLCDVTYCPKTVGLRRLSGSQAPLKAPTFPDHHLLQPGALPERLAAPDTPLVAIGATVLREAASFWLAPPADLRLRARAALRAARASRTSRAAHTARTPRTSRASYAAHTPRAARRCPAVFPPPRRRPEGRITSSPQPPPAGTYLRLFISEMTNLPGGCLSRPPRERSVLIAAAGLLAREKTSF